MEHKRELLDVRLKLLMRIVALIIPTITMVSSHDSRKELSDSSSLLLSLSLSKTVEMRTERGGVWVIVMSKLMSDEAYAVLQWRYQVHGTLKFPRLRRYPVFIINGDDTLSKSIMV